MIVKRPVELLIGHLAPGRSGRAFARDRRARPPTATEGRRARRRLPAAERATARFRSPRSARCPPEGTMDPAWAPTRRAAQRRDARPRWGRPPPARAPAPALH